MTAVLFAVLVLAFRPGTWRVTTRNVLARQLLFSGVEAVPFLALTAFLVGISIVVQIQLWLTRFGQTQLIGPVLVVVLIREVGPILTCFVVIGRSGTAVATEVGNMRVRGELRTLEALGIDVLSYLVLPRVLALGVAVFCLTIAFVVVSLFSGFLCGIALGASTGNASVFVRSVFGAIQPIDLVSCTAKTLLPGSLTGAICCLEGLRVRPEITDVPRATTRSVVRSVAALFLVSAAVSVLTYF